MPKSVTGSPFHTTRWTLVGEAKQPGEDGQRALNDLLRIYQSPLYSFARRKGLSPADAEDAVQGFFLIVIQRELFGKADAEKGRLRNLLLTAFKRYLIDESVKKHAARRHPGKGSGFVNLDLFEARLLVSERANEDAASLFDRERAHAVLDEALQNLRERYRTDDSLELFDALRPFLSETEVCPTQSDLAKTLGMSTNAVRVALHRLRKRFRESMHATICETIEEPSEAEAEFQELARILSQSPDGNA
jgi:RNA polymerase sigma-70 factor (ECF subfamily)